MSIVAFIPARGGSERIPGKNIRKLNGHPLLAYAIAGAKRAGMFDGIYVSTEDKEIARIAGQYGADTIRRPGLFSRSDSRDLHWIQHALGWLWPKDPDSFYILRPTNPFRTSATIKRARKQWGRSNAHSLRAMSRVKEHPNKMWKKGEVFMYPCEYPDYDLPTQMLPKNIYIQDGCIQIHRPSICRIRNDHTGAAVEGFFTEGYEGLDLNTEEDWILAEALLERGLATLEVIE